jgi:hypothetical protein
MQPKTLSPAIESAALDAMAEELVRQDTMLEESLDVLRQLRDTNLTVLPAFFEELEDACRPAARVAQPPTAMNFVRC